uniref:Lipase_3 domain-containing protein n=1 Tax=Caenorhabditis japonica TaxID=281687 RepID=A0A8R1DMI9_CAEJA
MANDKCLFRARTATTSFFIWSLCIGASNFEKCIDTEFYGQQILASFEADCSDLIFKGLCRVVIDIDEGQSLLGITFKSESEIGNTTPENLNKQVLTKFGTYGMVQKDLLTAFGRIWNNGLGAYMKQLWAEYCDLYISFSGYSLGACLAQMAAVRFQEEKWWPADQMFYYGYGTPRCGNEKTIKYDSWSSVASNTFSTCASNTCLTETPSPLDHSTYFGTTAANVDSLVCTDAKKFL